MIAVRPIAFVVLPGSLLWKLVLVLAGSALIALGAQLAIPLPFSPVPVTGQTFAVLLVAATLGRLGLASVIAYLASADCRGSRGSCPPVASLTSDCSRSSRAISSR